MSSPEENVPQEKPEGPIAQALVVEEPQEEPEPTEESADTQPIIARAEAFVTQTEGTMEDEHVEATLMDVEMAHSDKSEPDDTAQEAVAEIVSTAEPKEEENENDEQEADENVESETSSEADQPLPNSPKEGERSSTPSDEPTNDDGDADKEEAEEIADILVGAKEDEHIEDIEGSELSAKEASDRVARSIKSLAEESSARVEPVYSTRGRHVREEEPLDDRKSRDTSVRGQVDEDREPAALPAPTSFLESLNEEDRRTRTRFLPDVDGFRALCKAEVKSDLGLARSVVSSAGVTSTLSTRRPKGKKGQKDEGQMDLDDEEATGPSEDERASDNVRVGGSAVVELDNKEFLVPSSAFIAPANGGTDGIGVSSKKAKGQARSTYVVEALAAFNPPRPPESVGAKKKHRMLRWERRPQDVEVDLANYKKTVQRTREELRNAEKERGRIQMFGAILRVNYRDQLELLNEESAQLNEELSLIQTECVSAADLLTSRTRSRGAGKGSYLMRDVISVLKSRGAELAEQGIPATAPKATNRDTGFGGVTSFGFADWDKTSEVPVRKIASAWTLPGDKATTPYGDGVVLHVYGPSVLNAKETPPDDVHTKPPPTTTPVKCDMVDGDKVASPEQPSSSEKAPEVGHGFGTSEQDSDVVMETESAPPKEQKTPKEATTDTGEVLSNESADATKLKEGDKTDGSAKPTPEKSSSSEQAVKEYHMDQILSPRVCVRLQFGVGFFPVSAVKSKENPCSYSDAQLASRWKKMVETASMVGSVLDVAGMESVAPISLVDRDDTNESSMDIDAAGGEKEIGVEADKAMIDTVGLSDAPDSAEGIPCEKRFLPFGANLLPTVAGRGSLLAEAPVTSLETLIDDEIFHSAGALGSVSLKLFHYLRLRTLFIFSNITSTFE
jgi:hypothetical protein